MNQKDEVSHVNGTHDAVSTLLIADSLYGFGIVMHSLHTHTIKAVESYPNKRLTLGSLTMSGESFHHSYKKRGNMQENAEGVLVINACTRGKCRCPSPVGMQETSSKESHSNSPQ